MALPTKIKLGAKLPGGCVIDALEHRAALIAKSRLEQSQIWVRLLEWDWVGEDYGHTVVVFKTDDRVYWFDRANGSCQIEPKSLRARDVVREIMSSFEDVPIGARYV